MKKNIYKLYALATLLTLSACSSDDTVGQENVEERLVSMTFTASQEGEGGTRTYVNEVDNENNKTRIYWSGQDKISVFDVKGSVGKCFELSSGGGSKKGVFSGTASDEVDKYTAVYPYTEGAVLNDDGSVSNVVLPSTQTATAGSFDPNAALMMAESTTENKKSLSFKNVIGLVKVNPGFACSKIIIRPSDKTAVLAGKGKLTYNSGEPKIDFSESDEKSYIITLEGNIEANKDYYIAVPAATLNEKWSITFVSIDDKVYIRQSDRSITFERKKVIDLGTFKTEGTPWVRGERGIVDPKDEIDLGLQINIDGTNYKVIFAKSNLTALGLAGNETDFGDYFAWGATEPWLTSYTYNDGSFSDLSWKSGKKSGYIKENAPYYDGSSYIRYDEGNTLYPEDDAANLILGGKWQIPSQNIWKVLCENLLSTNWVEDKHGYKIDNNSNTLFIPATGYFDDTTCHYVKSAGYYWSSSVSSKSDAYCFRFSDSDYSSDSRSTRCSGFPIRPVRLELVIQ